MQRLELGTKRILILVGIVSSVFFAVLPIILESPPAQELISGNITMQNLAGVTKQPMWWNMFVPLAVLAIVGLTYLWIRDSKPEKNEDIVQIKQDITEMRKDIQALTDEIRKANLTRHGE